MSGRIESVRSTAKRLSRRQPKLPRIIMIGAYLVLGTFPSNKPILPLWTIIFPILIMAFMIYIDYRQMEIHRFAAGEQEWTSNERDAYGRKINNQTLLSLFALFLSVI